MLCQAGVLFWVTLYLSLFLEHRKAQFRALQDTAA